MEGMKYLYELFERMPQQGPGDNASTRRAFNALPTPLNEPAVLDIGCGSGRQTLELARMTNGKVFALDNHRGFLDRVMQKAGEEGLEKRIIPVKQSMLEMDFAPGSFDLIWSEGALYFMGFQNGLRRCRDLLKAEGYLALTELVYTVPDPPHPVIHYLESEYPDIHDAGERIELIRSEGYRLLLNFTLPESSWLERYYLPMERELSHLFEKYRNNQEALGVFEVFRNEVNFHRQYSKYYGYEFFVMQK